MKHFSNNIKSFRVAKDLSLRETAYLVGIMHLYLKRIEKGEAIPPEGVVRNLAKVLGVNAEDLLQLCHEQHVAKDSPRS